MIEQKTKVKNGRKRAKPFLKLKYTAFQSCLMSQLGLELIFMLVLCFVCASIEDSVWDCAQASLSLCWSPMRRYNILYNIGTQKNYNRSFLVMRRYANYNAQNFCDRFAQSDWDLWIFDNMKWLHMAIYPVGFKEWGLVLTLKATNTTYIVFFVVCWNVLEALLTNSVDPDQTAPAQGPLCLPLYLHKSILLTCIRHNFQMIFFRSRQRVKWHTFYFLLKSCPFYH